MYLSTQDVSRLHAASELMLRPFEHPSVIAYLQAVADTVNPIIGGFASISASRSQDGQIATASGTHSEQSVNEYAKWKLEDEGTNRALAFGHDVLAMSRVVGLDWDFFDMDPMVNQWYRPNGVHDAMVYLLHFREDNTLATIEFHNAVFGRPRFGTEGEEILKLLLPSFRAGIRMLYSVGDHRNWLASQMDKLGLNICVCNTNGHVVHLSASLRELLARDHDAATVVLSIQDAARSAAMALSGRSVAHGFALTHAHRIVQSSRARYRLCAAVPEQSMHFHTNEIMVAVSLLSGTVLPPEVIAVQFQVTKREAEVAALIARGARNDAIASALAISQHTARRHTEHLFAKLGVTTRAAVVALLRA